MVIARFVVRLLASVVAIPLVMGALVVGLGYGSLAFSQTEPLPLAKELQQVTWMEESVFTVTYRDQELGERLSRLEAAVFGQPNQAKSPQQRIEALDKALLKRQADRQAALATAAAKGGVSAQPAKVSAAGLESDPTLAPPVSGNQKIPSSTTEAPSVDSAVTDYPAVSAMEARIFGQPHPEAPLETRLNNLEIRVLGRPQQGTLAHRVDQLRLVVLGDTGGGAGPAAMPPAYTAASTTTTIPGIPPQQGLPVGVGVPNAGGPYGASDTNTRLAAMEQLVLKQTFPYDTESQRLDRLEMAVFNRVSPTDVTNPERMERLQAVTAAENTPSLTDSYGPGGGGGKPQSPARQLLPILLMIGLMFL